MVDLVDFTASDLWGTAIKGSLGRVGKICQEISSKKKKISTII